MNTRPTPETDHLENNLGNAAHPILSSFCRKLESERDEARFDLEFRRRLGDWQNKTINELTHARDEAREQRDRLAVALDLCLARLEHHTEFGALVQSDMSAMHSARDALQSLTTNELSNQ